MVEVIITRLLSLLALGCSVKVIVCDFPPYTVSLDVSSGTMLR